MYLGKYELYFSGKGRVVLPKKVREEVNGMWVVLMEGDGCIWGFGKSEFEKIGDKYLEKGLETKEGRRLRREFFTPAVMIELDSQGRMVVPAGLLEFAGIKGLGLVVIGAGDHFEIWEKVRLEQELSKLNLK